MSKISHHNIYIVCEGDKTEPYFLQRFIQWLERWGKVSYEYRIFPIPADDKNADSAIKSSRKTGGRKSSDKDNDIVKAAEGIEATAERGNPKNWAKHGFKMFPLYNEVYVVIDKDGHPYLPDIFKAEDVIRDLIENGKNIPTDFNKILKIVNKKKLDKPANSYNKFEEADTNFDKVFRIIFDSRSFEYYMLMHHERLYRCFNKTECGAKNGNGHTRYFHCCTDRAEPGACAGDVCINGYARVRDYWEDSKDENTFDYAVNIWKGMLNGEWIRDNAKGMNPGKDSYEMNPYCDFQFLLARLMEKPLLRDHVVHRIPLNNNYERVIARETDFLAMNDILVIENNTPLPLSLNEGWLSIYEIPDSNPPKKSLKKDTEHTYTQEQLDKFANSQNSKTLVKALHSSKINEFDSMKLDLSELLPPNCIGVLNIKDLGQDFIILP